MFIVKYQVIGFPGTQEAGPFLTRDIADQHRDDIAGYEGVFGAAVIDASVPEPKRAIDRLLDDE